MPKPRIDKERAKVIASQLAKYDDMKGGKAKVEREAGIAESTWYRALAGAQLEIPVAEKIERFLALENQEA